MQAEETGGEGAAASIARGRRTLMDAMPEAAVALADGARKGSVAHIKLLLQLLGLDEGELGPEEIRPRERTLEELLMEQWHKEP